MMPVLAALVMTQCPPPTGTFTIVPGAGSTNSLGQVLPVVQWTISCPAKGPSCPNDPQLSITDLRTELAADTAERVGRGSGYDSPQSTGSGVLPGLDSVVFGANVQFSAVAGCNNRGSLMRLTSAPVVFAPTGDATSRSALLRSGATVTGAVDPDQVPVGQSVHLSAAVAVLPAPTEDVVVRIEGAGVSFRKAYRRTGTGTDSLMAQAYRADPDANVTPTTPGAIRLWVEFLGTRSPEFVFTAVAGDGSGSAGSGGSAGGGSAGGSGSTGPRQGCSTAPGLWSLVAVALLRRWGGARRKPDAR
jgi:hypothetical protein